MPGTRTRAVLPVVISALLALAGCSSGATTDAGPDAGDRGPITIVAGQDDVIAARVAQWNSTHPSEQVTFVTLPSGADNQRERLIQNANIASDAYTVLELDVTWTAEFAANRWIEALPRERFALDQMLAPTVATATYRNQLFAVPSNSDAGLLYYRSDLLAAAGIATPPTTFDGIKAACAAVQRLPQASGMSCYVGQFDQYEGLTVNATEVINAAGGAVVDGGGKAVVDSPQAAAGLSVLAGWYADGTIPRAAITYKEEESRRAFVQGEAVFLRNWPYVYSTAAATDGSSAVTGKFGVAPLPGIAGPGRSTLGGKNYAISAFATHQGTALDFIAWITSREIQRANLVDGAIAPTYAALYADPELRSTYAYLADLQTAIEQAEPRPQVVRYGDLTAAVQARVLAAMTGTATVPDALLALQTDLSKVLGP